MHDTETQNNHAFIANARRTQIFHAAIRTLDEIGYVRASLAQIAKRAQISTALISYHFKDKEELMNYTLATLLSNTITFVLEHTNTAQSARAKLQAYIVAHLMYQDTHQDAYHALVEIIFNARTPDNVPYYRLNNEEDDPLRRELQDILRYGQQRGEFRHFPIAVMVTAIQGAIGEYWVNPHLAITINAVAYAEELVHLFERAVLCDAHGDQADTQMDC